MAKSDTHVLDYNIQVMLYVTLTAAKCVATYFLYRPKHPTKVHVWVGISLQGPPKYAFLKATWTLISIQRSFVQLCFLFLLQSFQVVIIL